MADEGLTVMNNDLETESVDMPTTPRRLWIIIPLALLAGGFVYVYCGHLLRAILSQFALLLFLIIGCAISLYSQFSKIATIILFAGAVCFYLAVMVDAYRIGQTGTRKPYQKWWSYILLFMLFQFSAIFITQMAKQYWFEAFFVPTSGMSDTIRPGDHIYVEKLLFNPNQIGRNAIVAFKHNRQPRGDVIILVRRVVALPGDKVQIENDQLFVNGQPVEEPYVIFNKNLPEGLRQVQKNYISTEPIPEGHVFLLGDNRWGSLDSRQFGPVSSSELLGEAKAIFWSREYEFVPPSREMPQGMEKRGAVRWSRVGIPLH